TCRRVAERLKKRGVEMELVNMFQEPPDRKTLESLARRYGARNILRRRSRHYKAERFDKLSDEEILDRVSKNTDLLRRPVIVVGDKAILGDRDEELRGAGLV
ncbi:MAG: ArsC/Spx/MgsR family protein, partial [Nitrososphaerota archaeon]